MIFDLIRWGRNKLYFLLSAMSYLICYLSVNIYKHRVFHSKIRALPKQPVKYSKITDKYLDLVFKWSISFIIIFLITIYIDFKATIHIFAIFCLGFMVDRVYIYFKEFLIHDGYSFEHEIYHLIKEHHKLQRYGFVKIHFDNTTTQDHYYESLVLVTDGYEKRCNNKNDPIFVTLFYPGSIKDLRALTETEDNSEDALMLFNHWNKLTARKDKRFVIRRVLIADDLSSSQEDRAWYEKTFSGLETVGVKRSDPDIEKIINELNRDLDFAVFEGCGEMVCLGSITGQITYLLLGSDGIGARNLLRIRAINKFKLAHEGMAHMLALYIPPIWKRERFE